MKYHAIIYSKLCAKGRLLKNDRPPLFSETILNKTPDLTEPKSVHKDATVFSAQIVPEAHASKNEKG